MMDFGDRVLALKTDGFGWVTPTGDLLTCPLYRHFEVVREAGFFVREIGELDLQSVAEAAKSCVERSESGEHPSWHEYQMAESDYNRDRFAVLSALYEAGWVRLGTINHGGRFVIEAEESDRAISRNMKTLKDIAIFAEAELATSTKIDNASSLDLNMSQRLNAYEGERAAKNSWW